MTSITTFKIDKQITNTLTANEKKILPLLIEAAKKIDKVFALQENSHYDGANLYPHDVQRSEIEEAARKDPRISRRVDRRLIWKVFS